VSAHWDVIVVGAARPGWPRLPSPPGRGIDPRPGEGRAPRYKTCGGGLVGFSLTALAALPVPVEVPVREQVDRISFSLRGRREFTRRDTDRSSRWCSGRSSTWPCAGRRRRGGPGPPPGHVRTVDQAGDTARVTLAGATN